ncbi:MAG: hypothetical protein ACKVHE_36950, partial [Planctomycetales bacterium]
MGSLRKKTATKRMPSGAQLFDRKGETFARWKTAAGKTRTAPTTTGKDGSLRIVVESGTYTAKYRDADGTVREVATRCRDKSAAAAMLAELERDCDRERAGIVTSKESAALGSCARPIAEHLDSFDAARQAEGLSDRQVRETRDLVETVSQGCGFKTLASVQRHKVEEWLAAKAGSGTGARRRNIYLQSLRTFLRWCVDSNRMLSDPLEGIARADQDADVRRERRALSEDELPRLLTATMLRPLAELGRETVMLEPEDGKRSSWTYAP